MPKIDHKANAVEALIGAGFVADGQTMTQHVRIPTQQNPVYGGLGGVRRTFGGRDRFQHPTGLRVTVGPRTVIFYILGKMVYQGLHQRRETIMLGMFSASDLAGITAFLTTIPEKVAEAKQRNGLD